MGRIVVRTHEGQEQYRHTGPLINFLREHWPQPVGFGDSSFQIAVNRTIWEDEDLLQDIGENDVCEIWVTPGGLGAGAIAGIIGATVSVVSLALSFLVRPTIPGQETGSSLYSVGVQANEARLGGVIPRPYGRVRRTPDYASESYRYFEDQQEHRVFLLNAGLGAHNVPNIFIGDTNVNDLPAGAVRSQLFKPQDHNSVGGTIETTFGIRENVVTSPVVQNLELRSLILTSEKNIDGTTTAGSDTFTLDPGEEYANTGVQPGDILQITNPSSVVGTYTLAAANTDSIVINETFPAALSGGDDINFQILAQGDAFVGYFPACAAGQTIDRIEVDIEMPRGQQTDRGRNITLIVEVEYREIDDNGDVVAGTSSVAQTFREMNATASPTRYTFGIDVPTARYEVRCRAQTARSQTVFGIDFGIEIDTEPGDVTEVRWTGLKGYIPIQPRVYGNCTILALEVIGQDGTGAQDRIFVDQISELPHYETGVVTESSNAADIAADIVRNTDYSIGLGSDQIVLADFAKLHAVSDANGGSNGVFDEQISVFSAIEEVTRHFECLPVRVRSPLGFAFDGVQDTVAATIGPWNRLLDSLDGGITLIKNDDVDGIELSYRDSTDFSEHTVLWPPPADDPDRLANPDNFDPVAVRPQSVEARFVTDVAPANLASTSRALNYARYLWNQRRLRSETWTFDVMAEALNWSLYDRVRLIIPEFGWGDKATSEVIGFDADARTVTLLKPVEEGVIVVSFRTGDGTPTTTFSGTANGTSTITLDQALPTLSVGDDGDATLIFIERAENSGRDFTVRNIAPSDDLFTATVTVQNYDETVPTLVESA